MARQGFVIYYKDFDDLDELTDADFRTLLRAIRAYSETGELTPLDGQAAMAFKFLRRGDDCDRERYEKRVGSGKKAIASRWDKTKSDDTNVYDRIRTNESYTSDSIPIPKPIPIPIPKPEQIPIPKDEEDTGVTGVASAPPRAKSSRFVKPSRDEVAVYCAERKNSVDPVRWYDHYEANGWTTGKTHMKDWKAAVRTWENNGYGNSPTPRGGSQKPGDWKHNPALDYAQREVKDEDYDDSSFLQEAKRIMEDKRR